MKHQGLLVQGLVIAALTVGCSADAGSSAGPAATSTPPAATTPGSEPTASATTPSAEPTVVLTEDARVLDAGEFARAMETELDRIVEIEVYTEDTDPNELIGRPGQYTSAAVLADKDAEGGTGTDRGATIEVFETADDAKVRSEYILGILKGESWLGTEWHHLSGTALLRVSGTLKPSVNKVYEQAWTQVTR